MRRWISLGAGVQSTCVALLAARHDIEPVEGAFFADTGWEPKSVYRHLDWLETIVPFPIVRIRRVGPDLGEHAIGVARGERKREATPPWYTDEPKGMLPKHCSKEFKTRVIGKAIREQLLGLQPGQRGPKQVVVQSLMGISTDEAHRMKRSEQGFVENVFPLYDLRMSRLDCLRWMEERQYPRPPKSSCIFCPYRTRPQHRELQEDVDQHDWNRLVQFDRAIRPGFPGMEGSAYVIRQVVPIDEADLSTPVETASRKGQNDLFGDFDEECEGMCGV